MGRRRIVAFACAAIAVVIACSTFDEATEVAPSDAGLDAWFDAIVPGDGPIGDAADFDGDAKQPWVPCAMRGVLDGPHLCDDFEHGGPIQVRWTSLIVGNGGTADFFDGGLDSPKAFQAKLPAGNTLTRAQLYKDLAPAPSSRVRLAYAARLDAPPHSIDGGNGGYSHFAVFEFDPPAPCITSGNSSARAVEVSLFPPNKVQLATKGLYPCVDGGTQVFTSTLLEISPADLTGGFHQFDLELSRVPCPGKPEPFGLRVAIEGMAQPHCHGFTFDVFAASTKVRVFLGASNGGGAFNETSWVYDNVTIDGE
jgi:hypothetical protein